MAVLKNWQHEKFCQEFHKLQWNGVQQREARIAAYKGAGFGGNDRTLDSNSRRLWIKPEVTNRITELASRAAELTAIDSSWAIEHLKNFVEANLSDYMTKDRRALDLTKATRAQMALLSEVTMDEGSRTRKGRPGPKRRIKIKLHDKIEALRTIATMAGWNAPQKHQHDGKVTLEMLVGASYEGKPATLIEPLTIENDAEE